MAIRKNLSHPDIVRQRIRVSQLLNRLQKQAFGKLELTQGQQKAIEILLRKALPDLSQVAHTGFIERRPEDFSDTDLVDIATRGSDRAAEETPSQTEPSELH